VNAARRAGWALGAPARLVLVVLIRVYRAALSGYFGGQCRFYPSCSHYAEAAVRSHGAIKGSALAVWRVLRCGPFTPGGVDHVPTPRRGLGGQYDAIIQQGTSGEPS
jgi:hypothetical protein